MRLIDWLMVFAVIVVAVIGKFVDFDKTPGQPEVARPAPLPSQKNPRRPRIEPYQPRAWDDETKAWMNTTPDKIRFDLPSRTIGSDVAIIEGKNERKSSVGSAFSISDTGSWLTARHVVSDCDDTAIQIGNDRYLRVQGISFHTGADVALLKTRGAPKALSLAPDTTRLSDAYGVGFPQGQPGAVHGRFLGEMTVHHRGRNAFRERVNAWSEASRIPGRPGSLGGISGGAVLNQQGQVIGLVQAGSPRRGRFMTAKMSTVDELFKQSNLSFARNGNTPTGLDLAPQFYPQTARQLITTVRVARVICIVR